MTTLDADRLQEFFRPKSVALVGATDKSGWSMSTYNNLLQHGFAGDVHLVNPKTPVVHGVETHRSLSDIPGPVDLAYVMTPIEVVPRILEEGAARGVRNYVILTAGYGEVGGEGEEGRVGKECGSRVDLGGGRVI